MKVGIFGFGAIGRVMVSDWGRLPSRFTLTAVCVRPHQVEEAQRTVPDGTIVVTDMEALLAQDLTVVIEAVGQDGARQHAGQVLRSGRDLYLLSTGILADHDTHDAIVDAARQTGTAILVPPGAMAGFDGLLALREQGLDKVLYTSIKPPAAWRGTPAETEHDLDRITASTILFDGTARQAAQLYPKNANLAAAIALAGLGFDRTQVRLVADPRVNGNLGRLDAEGGRGRLMVEVSGAATSSNPKSSAIVGLSVLSSLANTVAPLSYV